MARRALTADCLALVQAVERQVGGETSPGLVVALSGGADSLALAAAVAWAVQKAGGPLAGVAAAAHVIDHGLQPGSAAVAARAAAQAEALGLPAAVTRVTVTPTAAGLEADARTARYRALLGGSDDLADPSGSRLRNLASGPEIGWRNLIADESAPLVLTAHTLDDQAETVLLGLARGSGTRSLAGMPVRSGRLVRPFLELRRAQTRQACADWGLEPWDDPMNGDPAFARVRARAALAALERDLGPGLAEALARTAALAGADADYLDSLADAARADAAIGPGLGVTRLKGLPEALRGRVVLAWLRERGCADAGWTHVRAVLALVTEWHGQAGVDVPGGRVVRDGGRLVWVGTV
ncbi:MAG: tRNA lysidine(34) synthetase TilS [Propionibacteriaceae bacterium]|jgi:tRNA(Ile)-lysidine synthase|nr:tRNA lysidine(34) synthetase TilS [Propionibacteriaceae bacterium]